MRRALEIQARAACRDRDPDAAEVTRHERVHDLRATLRRDTSVDHAPTLAPGERFDRAAVRGEDEQGCLGLFVLRDSLEHRGDA